MKKRYYVALLVAFLCFMIFPNYKTQVSAATDATHPGFRVEGRFLYDNQGEKVTLYGLNKMCTWTDKDGDPAFKEIAKTGANCVRITWSITDSAENLDTVLTNCRKEHMIPIIELHDATGEWNKLSSLVDYWTQDDIAAVLISHQEYTIVNIGNEVGNGNVTDAQFTEGYTDAITRIRAAGIHVPLMIDGHTWGQSINVLQSCGPDLIEADPDHNILLSVHMWWPAMYGHNAQEVIDELTESYEMELPLVVGEFGHIWEESEAGKIPYQTIMEYCAKLDIGYIAWSWGPGNNPQTFLDMTSDGTFETLNDYGTEVCLTSQYSVKNLAVRPASMLTNLAPKLPAEGLPTGNLALGKPVTESTIEGTGYEGSMITDGNLASRWASSTSDPNWVTIDLGETKEITDVVILWEAAYASQYKIQVSNDNSTWTDAYTTYSCDGGTDEVSISASGRYVRIYCMQRFNYSWGCSIYEVGIYGPESALSAEITPSVAVFDKNPANQEDLVITTDPKENNLTGIYNGTEALVEGSDYTVNGNIVTISSTYLCTLTTGETSKLTFDYDTNSDPVLSIAVGDTSPVGGSTIKVSPVSATFNKFTAAQEDVTLTVNTSDFAISSITCGTAGLTNGSDFTVDGSTITISKAFLAQLPVGTVQLAITFADGTQATVALKVVYTAPNSSITPVTAAFEKRAQADIDVTMKLLGNTLVSITNGTYTLNEGVDYTVDGNVVTLKKEYLASIPVGTATFVFAFNNGNDASIKVTVTETIPNSIVNDTLVTYSSENAADTDISITLNGNTLSRIMNGTINLVEGEDYTINGNVVTIKKEYLAILSDAKTILTFIFSEGANQEVTLKNTSAAVPELQLKTEVNAWSTGYTMNFYVTNTTDATIGSWSLKVKKSDFNISNIWCAEATESGDYYIITPMSWNASLTPGGYTSFGLQGIGTPVADFEYVLV